MMSDFRCDSPGGGCLAPARTRCAAVAERRTDPILSDRCGRIYRFNASRGIPSTAVWSGRLLEFSRPRSVIVVPWTVPAFRSRCRAGPCRSGEVAQDPTAPSNETTSPHLRFNAADYQAGYAQSIFLNAWCPPRLSISVLNSSRNINVVLHIVEDFRMEK